jgi:ribosome-associated translation inhibitor RaiA
MNLQITFHGARPSDALAAKIRSRAAKLEQYCDSIIACRVAVEAPHHHHRSGRHYRVRVEASVPGDRLVATHEADAHHAYTDPYVAVRDAFDAMRRQLEDYVRLRRGEMKAHESAP